MLGRWGKGFPYMYFIQLSTCKGPLLPCLFHTWLRGGGGEVPPLLSSDTDPVIPAETRTLGLFCCAHDTGSIPSERRDTTARDRQPSSAGT